MKKTKLLVCNIIIAAICAFVLFMYYSQPFLSISLGVKLDADTIQSFVGGSNGGDEGSSPLGGLDLKGALGENGVEIKLSLSVESKALFKSIKLSDEGVKQFIEDEIVGPNIDKIIKDVTEPLTSVVTNVIKEKANVVIKEKLSELGVNSSDENVANAINTIIDKFNEENVALDDFTTTITQQIDILSDGANYDKEKIQSEISDLLTQFGLVEDGKISDPVAALTKLIPGISGGETKNEENIDNKGNEGQSANTGLSISNFAEDATDRADSSLANLLKTKISEKIVNDKTTKIMLIAFKALAGILIFLMFTWAIVFILSLAKLGAKNPGVKVWLPVVFGGGFIGGILHIAQMAIKLFLSSGKIPMLDSLPAGLSIEITTSMFYACCGACGLIILCWFVGYARTRRRLRKELKYGDSSSKKGCKKSDDDDDEPSDNSKKVVTKTTTKTVTKKSK